MSRGQTPQGSRREDNPGYESLFRGLSPVVRPGCASFAIHRCDWVRAGSFSPHSHYEGQMQGKLEKWFCNPLNSKKAFLLFVEKHYDVGRVSLKPQEANISKSTAGLLSAQAFGHLPSNLMPRYHLPQSYCVTPKPLKSWLHFKIYLQSLYTSVAFPFFWWHFQISLHCSEGWRELGGERESQRWFLWEKQL